MLLLLDESGEKLIPIPASGEVEGRAGYFDLSLDGRWGGVISGDKVPRGHGSPARAAIAVRRSTPKSSATPDMASGDKIACSGHDRRVCAGHRLTVPFAARFCCIIAAEKTGACG